MTLILASTSPIRRALLEAAGVAFECRAPGIDEAAVKPVHDDPASLAEALARAKAEAVGRCAPDAWVIGSDSVVTVNGRMFDKPADRGEAAGHLRYFSGREMRLTSAVAIALGGSSDWHHVDEARLQVRRLSEEFIASYLEREWPEVAYCVGVFRLEGPGVQLFERIEGSHFTILGLPLLPLLGALRDRRVIAG